ncbi:MAG: asparagine synthase (glutamine-hydrolyzing), partial [Candidatus Zixiibacteriota bacterium]
MCGIAGYVQLNQKKVSFDSLQRMTQALEHRGPDDQGYFYTSQMGLGHRRLSIIDLSVSGRQPIYNEDKTVAAIFNGEIYNFQEIREDLIKKHHQFATRTDTEVIVHAYEEWGIDCLRKFNGMFAIVIYSVLEQKLFLVRDRLGIKPLYYYEDEGNFAFASEIKALLKYPYFKKELDLDTLQQYLGLGYILAPKSIFKNVKKLLPGYYLSIDLIKKETRRESFWEIPLNGNGYPLKSEEEYLEELDHLLERETFYRLISDVPVGAFLSGGVDSSTVVAYMVKSGHRKVRTFSVGTPTKANNENIYARKVAEILGTQHTQFYLSPQDIKNYILKIPQFCDEPYADSSFIPIHILSGKAREQGMKVLLSGDGGDELFFGYPNYHLRALARYISQVVPQPVRKRMLNFADLFSFSNKFYKGICAIGCDNYLESIFYITGNGLSISEMSQVLFDRRFDVRQTIFYPLIQRHQNLPFYEQLMLLDINTYMVDNNLVRMDRGGMSCGVEIRVPLISHHVVEFAMNLPFRLKYKNKIRKYLLKMALSQFLPWELIDRPKHGFDPLPLSDWFR